MTFIIQIALGIVLGMIILALLPAMLVGAGILLAILVPIGIIVAIAVYAPEFGVVLLIICIVRGAIEGSSNKTPASLDESIEKNNEVEN